jgi:prevent-host-death family protein
MKEQIISLTDFKTSASRLLQETRGGANIILTQNGTASAVVQDYATYRAQQDAFLLLKLMVQGEADIQKNRLAPQEKVFGSLRASLLIQQNPSGLKQQKQHG